MRIVTYGAACSVDGFITAPDGSTDWLNFSKDVQAVMAEYWRTIDTVLMGRKTFEFAEAMGRGGGDEDSRITTYVFSRTLPEKPGVTVVREDAGDFVAELKKRPGKGICLLGGGELARSLLRAGVVDEVRTNIHPILLGGGLPLLPAIGRRISLQLIDSRTMAGGCIYARYQVTGR